MKATELEEGKESKRYKELEDELRTAEAPISLSFFGKSKKASNLQQNSKSDNEKSKE